MTSGIAIFRARGQPMAECEGCNGVLPVEPTRAEVRAHVRDTRHTVYVLVEESTYYKPEED